MLLKIRNVCRLIWADIVVYRYAFLGIGIYYAVTRILFQAFCPMWIFTGLPCPGCGMTRAVTFCLTGQFERSFYQNPLAVGWIIVGVWFFIRRYVCQKKVKGIKIMIFVLCLLMFIFYLYRMTNNFPSHAPMTYNYKNIVNKFFPIYEEILRIFWNL